MILASNGAAERADGVISQPAQGNSDHNEVGFSPLKPWCWVLILFIEAHILPDFVCIYCISNSC
jgi:hypothetical protein